jgi:hypothetical protein
LYFIDERSGLSEILSDLHRMHAFSLGDVGVDFTPFGLILDDKEIPGCRQPSTS